MKTENPEVAKSVETFRELFHRQWAEFARHLHLEGEEVDHLQNLKSEMWRVFSSNYVNVLASMYGWKEVAENEKEKKRKAMNVIADIIAKD